MEIDRHLGHDGGELAAVAGTWRDTMIVAILGLCVVAGWILGRAVARMLGVAK